MCLVLNELQVCITCKRICLLHAYFYDVCSFVILAVLFQDFEKLESCLFSVLFLHNAISNLSRLLNSVHIERNWMCHLCMNEFCTLVLKFDLF